jgi:hypothetical protein
MGSKALEMAEIQIRGMEVETADIRLGLGLVTSWWQVGLGYFLLHLLTAEERSLGWN